MGAVTNQLSLSFERKKDKSDYFLSMPPSVTKTTARKSSFELFLSVEIVDRWLLDVVKSYVQFLSSRSCL